MRNPSLYLYFGFMYKGVTSLLAEFHATACGLHASNIAAVPLHFHGKHNTPPTVCNCLTYFCYLTYFHGVLQVLNKVQAFLVGYHFVLRLLFDFDTKLQSLVPCNKIFTVVLAVSIYSSSGLQVFQIAVAQLSGL